MIPISFHVCKIVLHCIRFLHQMWIRKLHVKDAFLFETEPIKKASILFSSSIYLLAILGKQIQDGCKR